jgi:hypothetical protein
MIPERCHPHLHYTRISVEYHTTIASTNQDHISATEYINQQKTFITNLVELII